MMVRCPLCGCPTSKPVEQRWLGFDQGFECGCGLRWWTSTGQTEWSDWGVIWIKKWESMHHFVPYGCLWVMGEEACG